MNTYHVYAIVNVKTHDAYVGCTVYLKRRSWRHLDALNKRQHQSPKLQEAWERDGPDAFQVNVLLVLEGVPLKTAAQAEAIWISKIGTYNERGADPETGAAIWSDAMRSTMAAHTRRRWADAELSKAMAKGLKPENRFAKGAAPRKTPEMDAAHSEHMKAVWADPVKSGKLKARLQARWTDPEARARQAEKMRAYHAARRASQT